MKIFTWATLLLLLFLDNYANSQEFEHPEHERAFADLAQMGGTYERGVVSIRLAGSQEVTADRLAMLSVLAGDLHSLDLSSSRIDDETLRGLYFYRRLKNLNLSQTPVTDKAFGHLAPLKDLRSLSLAKTSITGSGLVELKGLKQLESLDLSQTKIDRVGLKSLKIFPSLKTLSLAGTEIDNQRLADLWGVTNLETLNLDHTQLEQDGGLGALLYPLGREQGLKTLQSISLTRTRVNDNVINHIGHMPELKELIIAYTQISPRGLGELAAMRKHGLLTQLRVFRISEDQLTDDVREELEDAFPDIRIVVYR